MRTQTLIKKPHSEARRIERIERRVEDRKGKARKGSSRATDRMVRQTGDLSAFSCLLKNAFWHIQIRLCTSKCISGVHKLICVNRKADPVYTRRVET